MARYLMSVYGPTDPAKHGTRMTREEKVQSFADTGAFNERLQADGHWVFADGLAPATTATTVDGRGDSPVITDGPYLEAKEHLGGFWVVEAADLDEALALAAEASKACRETVEVRPFQTAEDIEAMLA